MGSYGGKMVAWVPNWAVMARNGAMGVETGAMVLKWGQSGCLGVETGGWVSKRVDTGGWVWKWVVGC